MADEMAKEDAKVQPLVIFYDSEAANGNVYCGDIIEIAAKCHPDIVKGSFQSLINTKQPLCAFATRECGISEEDLENKPNFKEVLMKFVSWIDDMVKLAKKRHGTPFLPVLCAHYGYQFDFLILLSNMERSGLNHSILTQHNVHFSDSLLFCREVKDNGEKSLANTRLSLDALFKKFFPRKSLKDRHRAMGDVDGMVKIFTQTPLRKLLHQMKYSSTNERLEYYCSQSASKQQQRILEEKFCKLDACSKNMSIKKLLREGVTYNTLRKIFEECCSFLDFYETMKTYGIERKVSKIMALHFSGQGLQNEGARAFHKLHEEKLMQPSSEPQENDSGQKPTSKISATSNLQEEATEVPSQHQENDKALPCDRSRHKPASKMPAQGNLQKEAIEVPSQRQDNVKSSQCDRAKQKLQSNVSASSNPQDTTNSSLPVEATEDWEEEVATAAPRQGFTLKCTTPTPLSLMVEDLSAFPQPAKTIPKEKPQAKSDHCPSEKDNSRDAQVIDKRPQGKAKRVEVRNGSGQLKFNTSNQLSERNGRWKKPVRENKQEGRLKKEAVFPKRGNKNEAVKKRPLESTNACVSEERLDVKKDDSSVSSVPLEEIKPKTELVESRLKKSQPAVIFDQDGDSSVGDTIQKFTSIFIGDIAILVPVEESVDADSNELELNKSNQAEKETFTKCNKVVDNSAFESIATGIKQHVQGHAEAVLSKPDKVVENSQLSQELSAHNATECVGTAESRSESETTHKTAEKLAQEQAEVTVSMCNKVLEASQLNLESTEENTGLSSKMSSSSQSEQDMPADGYKEMSTQGQGNETTSSLTLGLEQSSGYDLTPDPLLVSSFRPEKMNDSDNANKDVTTGLTFSSNLVAENVIPDFKNASKGDIEVVEGTDHQHTILRVPTNVTSIAGQGTTCSVYSDPHHDKSAIGESSNIGFPWKDLQQMPCSSVPGDVPLASTDPSMYGSLAMNQELSSHFISTDDVDQSHRDLQAELSSESSSTSEEQSMDAFPREPPLGAERGYTPDTVQQQPSQQGWLGNADNGIYQMSPSPGLNNYNQASFPSLHNPYGTFPHSQQPLPLLKPCYPSFTYPNHVRPVIPHQMMHHPQQVLMPPFQYRSQMMFSNMVPQSVGFQALPPSQFQPQMLPFIPAAAGYSCPSVPFYSSPYQQSQQTTNTAVDINSTVLMHPTDALPQVGPAVDDYQSPNMDSNGSLDSDEREDSSSELSSSDSSLELIISSTATQMYGSSTRAAQESFPVQVESKSGFSASVTFDGNQKETIDEQKDKGPLSGNISDCKNDGQIFSLAHVCYKELSSGAVDASCANRSKELFSHQLTEGQEDPVHKQITILSREESGISMGRRLSPDGSSVDGICLDLPSNASPVRNNEEDFKEKPSSASHRQDLAEELSSNRPSGVEEKGERRKDRSPSPKPQRFKGGRGRRNKNAQTSSGALQKDILGSTSGPSTQNTMSGMCTGAQSVSSKEYFDSCKQGDFHSSNIGHQTTQKDRNHRRVRFSNENVELQSSKTSKTSDNPCQENTPITRQENEKETIAPVEEISGLSSTGNQSVNNMGGNQSLSVDKTVTKTTKVEGHYEHGVSQYKTGPQQHVERRANADIRQGNIRAGNSRKRVFNDKTKRHYKEKQTVKDLLDVEKTEAESRTDKNNNSK